MNDLLSGEAGEVEEALGGLSDEIQEEFGQDETELALYEGDELTQESELYAQEDEIGMGGYSKEDDGIYINANEKNMTSTDEMMTTLGHENRHRTDYLEDENTSEELADRGGEDLTAAWENANNRGGRTATDGTTDNYTNWKDDNQTAMEKSTGKAEVAKDVEKRVIVYSRPVSKTGKTHIFAEVSERKNGEPDVLISLTGDPLGGEAKVDVETLDDLSTSDKKRAIDKDYSHLIKKTTSEQQVINVPEGMTESEFDELVIENAGKYDTKNPSNRYPVAGGILEDLLSNPLIGTVSKNSNTFIDNVIEESGGMKKDFDNALLQNSGETMEQWIRIINESGGSSEQKIESDIRSFRGFE